MGNGPLQFLREEKGSILAEALIVIPVITIFAVGVMEFGNIFWQRLQLETGVRDAARYWSRCRPSSTEFLSICDITIARNIGFYGTPDGSGGLRVPGWDDDSELSIDPAVPSIPSSDDEIVTVTGEVAYQSSPLFGFLGIQPITLQFTYQQRYIGW